MTAKIIFYAPNVHTGGGLVLLKGLLDCLESGQAFRLFLDERARPHLSILPESIVHWVMPCMTERWAAQLRLRNESDESTTIICFNGLPPLLSVRGRVVVFLQNRLYLHAPEYRKYALKVAIRIAFERCVSRVFRHRVDLYIVQTPSMAHSLVQWYVQGCQQVPDVYIVPFTHSSQAGTMVSSTVELPEWDFIYVADGLPHKNHTKLLEAWCILAKEGFRPRLALTLPSSERALLESVSHLRNSAGLKVVNLGRLSHDQVLNTYLKARALIYPSLAESFGLPLIEARQLNLPIIAGELDYVRDVCKPVETFDPTSEVSIARAVRRFLNAAEPVKEPSGPEEFWRVILDEPSQHLK